jgi:hypothetical protein
MTRAVNIILCSASKLLASGASLVAVHFTGHLEKRKKELPAKSQRKKTYLGLD